MEVQKNDCGTAPIHCPEGAGPVSYTHLDVYKGQAQAPGHHGYDTEQAVRLGLTGGLVIGLAKAQEAGQCLGKMCIRDRYPIIPILSSQSGHFSRFRVQKKGFIPVLSPAAQEKSAIVPLGGFICIAGKPGEALRAGDAKLVP